jgi:MscS family membrane protein
MDFLKRFLPLFILVLLASSLYGESKYTPFIEKQLQFTKIINDNNITKDELNDIMKKQKNSFGVILKDIMRNKDAYEDYKNIYSDKIFSLKKIININKRAGNTYAVLRDEVQIKSYQLLDNQNKMIFNVLNSLEHEDRDIFSEKLTNAIIENEKDNKKLFSVNYDRYLEIHSTSKTLKKAQENIEEFYALKDINVDVINYLHIFENVIYRLNKYSKYNLIGAVLYVQSTPVSKVVDPILTPYGLDIVKILIIISLILISYVTRKFALSSVENYILKLETLKKYSKQIISAVIKPIDILIVIININLVIYVYNNFRAIEIFDKFFNMVYALIFTIVIYKILNAIAAIKIEKITQTEKRVKNEIINVSLKIVNFTILIIGLLLLLHFAGANLTAVLSGLGIGGFAVALAAKDSLANFFGTLSILISDVYSQGDWIAVDGQEGTVVEIGLRVTTLRTFDNALVSIPNSVLANKDVKNWNKRLLGRRIKMKLGVKYDSKASDIKTAIDEIRDMLEKHPGIATENMSFKYDVKKSARLVSKEDLKGVKKTLLVYLDEFSDSSINILVYCFSRSVNWQDWLEVKEDVMHKIMEIFEKNNLEFAFPSISIYKENSC